MSACGGANNGTNSSANDSTNNTAVDFPLYSAEGLTNGSSAIELTPEQLANATQSLQAFEQSSQTQTNVNGFIVKYKNDNSMAMENANASTIEAVAQDDSPFSLQKADQVLSKYNVNAINCLKKLN